MLKEITIDIDEYKKLLALEAKVQAAQIYINSEKYTSDLVLYKIIGIEKNVSSEVEKEKTKC